MARGAEMLETGCLELVGLIDQFDVYIYISMPIVSLIIYYCYCLCFGKGHCD